MKRTAIIILIGLVVIYLVASTRNMGCIGIKDEVLKYSKDHYLSGQLIENGQDAFGYNYQAHLYNGNYADTELWKYKLPPYEGNEAEYLSKYPKAAKYSFWSQRDLDIVMKWNDPYLSNKDCDGDGKLDTHYGLRTYVGSGAYHTTHMSGEYLAQGQTCTWSYFIKVVSAPTDAVLRGGYYYTPDNSLIGRNMKGGFVAIQEVTTDPCGELDQSNLNPPEPTGLGYYQETEV